MITVYTGPMFSGKSTTLIETYQNLITNNISKNNILCFKPSKDIRDYTKIRARNVNTKIDAIVISKFETILDYITNDIKYIFIDEIQFIDGDFNILSKLSIENNIDIYISGLSQTSEQTPFGTMPYILAIADNVMKLKAKCECGKEAPYTYCKENKQQKILIGDKEYIPLCRECLLKYKGGK